MIHLDLPRFFKDKGIQKPLPWMKKQGIANSTAYKLLHGDFKRGVPLHHLALICERLWGTPNDLMKWIPDHKADDHPDHPLQALKRQAATDDLTNLVARLRLDQIEELKKMAKKMRDEGK